MVHYLFLALVVLSQVAFGKQPIATVVAIVGNVVVQEKEKTYPLLEQSKVFVGDLIVVGEDAKAQFQFIDGSVVNLISDTEFRVTEYQYREMFQKDKAASELLKGGLRLISGSIAKKNPNGYEVNTPVGTIGLRGTVIEAFLSGSQLYVGVQSGRAIVINQAGSTFVGLGETSNFVHVPSQNLAAELVFQRPPVLENSRFEPPKGGLSVAAVQAMQETKAGAPVAAAAPATGSAPPTPAKEGEAPTAAAPGKEEAPPAAAAAPTKEGEAPPAVAAAPAKESEAPSPPAPAKEGAAPTVVNAPLTPETPPTSDALQSPHSSPALAEPAHGGKVVAGC